MGRRGWDLISRVEVESIGKEKEEAWDKEFLRQEKVMKTVFAKWIEGKKKDEERLRKKRRERM